MGHLRFTILGALLFESALLFGQFNFGQSQAIPVQDELGQPLNLAWAGGMNFCQYHSLDMDLDGVQDLLIFDRSGDRVLPFLRSGPAGSLAYTYAPHIRNKLPKLNNWIISRDYDGDGKWDLFVHRQPGIAVYRNTSSSGELSFSLTTSLLTYQEGSNAPTLLSSARDIPTFSDIDEDGDLDLLQFDAAGSQIEYFQNQSIEQFGHADSLVFQLADNCWGGFMESGLSNTISLQVGCKGLTSTAEPHVPEEQHAGSTLLALDLDGDQDKELLVGDIGANNLVMLSNGGTTSFSDMTAQNPAFPGFLPVNLPTFPAAFSLDLDQDGLRDLLVSPNGVNVSENFQSSWWYRNIGTADSADFILSKFAAIQDQMIDVGEGAIPVLHDYDRDGLMDLIIANYGYYDNGNYGSRMALFRNTGTTTEPAFTLLDRDWQLLSLSSLPAYQHPAFGDFDGDGDDDLILGGQNGKIRYLENQAQAGELPSYPSIVSGWQNIDVGEYAAPAILDVNGDSLLDIIIGEKDGNLNYYENTGTAQSPSFALVSTLFGGVSVSTANFVAGYSVPIIWQRDSIRELLVGSESGRIFRYEGLDGDLTIPFVLLDSTFGRAPHGIRAIPAISDLNADGRPDLIVGNYAGGVELFLGQAPVSIGEEAVQIPAVRVYPNPASNYVTIEISSSRLQKLRIYDLNGRFVKEHSVLGKTSLDATQLAPGYYFYQIGGITGRIMLMN